MTTEPAHVRTYRRYRTTAIVLMIVGVLLTIALIATPIWILGVLTALTGFMVLATARGQLDRSTIYAPENFEELDYTGWIDVVGESFNLVPIKRLYSISGGSATTHTAVLVPEPTNKKDPNAVRVIIPYAGRPYPVGHLPREVAADIKPILSSYRERGKSATVSAVIQDPFVNERGQTMHGVTIYIGAAPQKLTRKKATATKPLPESPAPSVAPQQVETPQPVATHNQVDLTEQIAKLAALRDSGILTEDEFVAKKTELPDDDPDVIAGMLRLAELRRVEGEIPEIGAR